MTYVFVTALLGLGAINSQNNLLFWTFGVAVGVMVVSGVLSGSMLMRVEAEREPAGEDGWVAVGAVGEPLSIRHVVRVRSRLLGAFSLHVVEPALRDERPDGSVIKRAKRPPLWPGGSAFVPFAGPGRTVTAAVVAVPQRRGLLHLRGFSVHSSFPFGLLRKTLLLEPERPARAVVRPAVRPVRAGLLRDAAFASGEGEALIESLGRSEEFFGLREYAPGDSPRSIAWKATARTGTTVVKETAARAPARLWVVVAPREGDALQRADDAATETSMSIAASILAAAERERIEAGLVISVRPASEADGEAVVIRPRLGHGHTGRMLDALACAPGAGGDLAVASEALAREGRSRGALVLVCAGEPPERLPVMLRGALRLTGLRPGEAFESGSPIEKGPGT